MWLFRPVRLTVHLWAPMDEQLPKDPTGKTFPENMTWLTNWVWTTLHVGTWLSTVGMVEYVDLFNWTTGKTLLHYSLADLKELGMPAGAAVPLSKLIQADLLANGPTSQNPVASNKNKKPKPKFSGFSLPEFKIPALEGALDERHSQLLVCPLRCRFSLTHEYSRIALAQLRKQCTAAISIFDWKKLEQQVAEIVTQGSQYGKYSKTHPVFSVWTVSRLQIYSRAAQTDQEEQQKALFKLFTLEPKFQYLITPELPQHVLKTTYESKSERVALSALIVVCSQQS